MANIKGLYSTLSDDVLAELSKNGDDKAFDELAVRYVRLISHIARKYKKDGCEENDFLQEGLLGLLHACKKYDAARGASFKNFLALVVDRRFISFVRPMKSKKAIPSDNLISLEDIEVETELEKSPEEKLIETDRLRGVLKRLNTILSAMEYEVLILFASGLSYSKISQKLNISEKSVDNALQRARKKIGASGMSLD